MKTNVQSVHFTADQKLLLFIENKLEKLDRIYEGIIDTSVILKLENSGQIKDKVAEFIVSVPKNRLMASSKSRTFEQSVDEGIDAIIKQLKKIKGKQQNSYKSVKEM